MSAAFDGQCDCATRQRWDLDQWIEEEILALRIAELLQPLRSGERHAVMAEVAVLLTHTGQS